MPKKSLEFYIEYALFAGRWILAPFYVGLLGALLVLLLTFMRELWHLGVYAFTLTRNDALVGVLSLIDISLAANLVLIVILSGYEYFVSRIDLDGLKDISDVKRTMDFSSLKIKLLASIVAISAIDLLEAYLNIEHMTDLQMHWMVIVFSTFVISCLLLAITEWFGAGQKKAR